MVVEHLNSSIIKSPAQVHSKLTFVYDPRSHNNDESGIQDEYDDPRCSAVKQEMETRLSASLQRAGFDSLPHLFLAFLEGEGKVLSHEVSLSGLNESLTSDSEYSDSRLPTGKLIRSMLLNRAITGPVYASALITGSTR